MTERFLDDILFRSGPTDIAVDHTYLIRCLGATGQAIWFGEQQLTLANPIPLITSSTPPTLRLTVRSNPPTLPLVLARWLNKQYHRPAGTIAKLAQLSKSSYHLITPVLYSTIVLGGDHQHECLRIPHAADLLQSMGAPKMAAGAVIAETYFHLDEWSNTIRKLDLLNTTRTIYIDGPLPEALSLDLLAQCHLNIFPRAKCIVFGPNAVESIGSTRIDDFEPVFPDGTPTIQIPSWAARNPLIHSLNERRPVWLSALVAITEPERLYAHFKQVAHQDWREMEHGQYCTCCGFREMIQYLGPPLQWNSLKVFHVYGIVDQHIPIVLTCRHVIHFASHLRHAKPNPGSNSDTTPSTPSLVEVSPNPNGNLDYRGPHWFERILKIASVPVSGRYFLSSTWGSVTHQSTWPDTFTAEAWNIAGHVESDSAPPDHGPALLENYYELASRSLRDRYSLMGVRIDDTPNAGRDVTVSMELKKCEGVCECGEDHSPRLA